MGSCCCRVQSILFGRKPYKVLQCSGRNRPSGCAARPDHAIWWSVAGKAARRTAAVRLLYLVVPRYHKARASSPANRNTIQKFPPTRLSAQLLALHSLTKTCVMLFLYSTAMAENAVPNPTAVRRKVDADLVFRGRERKGTGRQLCNVVITCSIRFFVGFWERKFGGGFGG